MNKQLIYNETVAQYREWYGNEHDGQGACLYWAMTGGVILQRHGIRSLPQAGTMFWPANDNPTGHTHFGYEWNPEDEGSQAAFALGLFPEIHVWLGLPETEEIVDFSVSHLPALAAADGVPWTRPAPPQYLWASESEMPEGVVYSPNMEAIGWLLNRLTKDGCLRAA